MSIITCRFCRRTGVKAKEHIWPKWLQKQIYGGTNWPYSGTHTFFYAIPISQRKHTGENLVLGDVCKECNNGWMNDLETNFKLVLDKLKSNPKALMELTKNERQDLVKWAFKTAIVINAGTNYRKLVPISHFHHLNDHRALPKDVKVDVCFVEKDEKLRWVQSPLMYAIGKTSQIQNANEILGDNNYCIALQVYGIGMRVTWYESLKAQGFELEATGSGNVCRFWPYEKKKLLFQKDSFEDIEEFQSSIMLKVN